jgi:hypothetical protein
MMMLMMLMMRCDAVGSSDDAALRLRRARLCGEAMRRGEARLRCGVVWCGVNDFGGPVHQVVLRLIRFD